MSRHCRHSQKPNIWFGSGLSFLSRTFHMHIAYSLYSVGTREIGRQRPSQEMSPLFGTKETSNSAQSASLSATAVCKKTCVTTGRRSKIVPGTLSRPVATLDFHQFHGLLELLKTQFTQCAKSSVWSRTDSSTNCGFVQSCIGQRPHQSQTLSKAQVNGCLADLCVSLISSYLVRHS